MAIEWFDHPLYSEVRADGVLTPELWVGVGDMPIAQGSRLLVDYSGVTRIEVTLAQLIGTAEAMVAVGLVVAVLATNETIFGICRQVLNMAHVDQGLNFAAFRDREAAVEWLVRNACQASAPTG
jgi:hypothetical protein